MTLGDRAAALVRQAEAGLFHALMRLPGPAQRVLAGRPVVVDGQRLDTEVQWMLRLRALRRTPAAEDLPTAQARAAIVREARLVGGSQPIGEVRILEVDGADGPIPAHLYVPRSRLGSTDPHSPLLFFAHGGGMMYGDLDSHDPVCRFLAEQASVPVLSVDYRLAPEHPFPAAVDDCWASYLWTVRNAEQLGVDPERIAVGGDSAGGYLSAVTAIRAAREGVPVKHQLLVYPVTNMAEQSHSRRVFGEGFYLTTTFMDLAESAYLRCEVDRLDPRASVQLTQDLPDGLAPALVVTAGFDPLRDEGEAYARLLADAGVPVKTIRFPGLVHGFLNIVGVGRSNRAAAKRVAAELRTTLTSASEEPPARSHS